MTMGKCARRGRERQEQLAKKNKRDREWEEKLSGYDDEMKEAILAQLKKRERIRKLTSFLCIVLAVGCLGYFGAYYYFHERTSADTEALASMKIASGNVQTSLAYTLAADREAPVLDEYVNLLAKNKNLIGWLKIDDTNIDYPVMQNGDREYYLTHNFNQESDKNGCIFMDPDCDVLQPSTNLIVYGHHMSSGKMFGKLDLYKDREYMKAHDTIQFDTIYEKGIYKVAYVFMDEVHADNEVTFKYYQFIDANSEEEFNSNISAIEKMALFGANVSVSYGDRLLTLSTCDKTETKDGRFVILAKKIG